MNELPTFEQINKSQAKNQWDVGNKVLYDLCKHNFDHTNCGQQIKTKGGGFYIEVAHIEPVAEGGRRVLGNLLVLCPNHHKEFDYGELSISEQTMTKISGLLNGTPFEINFTA